ncbi:hypothetical protein ONR75_25855 [Rhodopseudomonas sp. P2A-2r]|uniref:hypothetical protein n=1 Tax=Rhodopseudomonas sp. P2A-2r TaxID=2991972 RepID=UPI002234D364|nr:hypothetical protein [Rhodopseudomonas sp. P2A-2r]UZE48215.1 hypothetical protein ONR75_25855 [Rhodopseudomonas sp. P2A-2r]
MKDHAMRRAMPHRDDGTTFIGAAPRSLFRERYAAALTYAAVRLSLSGIREKSTELPSMPLAPDKIGKKARLMRRVLPKLLAMLRCGL